MKYLKNLSKSKLKGKIALLRIDLNVKKISRKSFRIKAILPSIKFLLKNDAKVIILSHLGRPKPLDLGVKISGFREFSLKPAARILSELLSKKVKFVDFDKIFDFDYRNSLNRIFLLENLRFFEGEKSNDKKLAKKLANLGDIYVNDAFAVSHRKNASVVAITDYLPAYAGLRLEQEIKNLDLVMNKYKNPLLLIIGGAKVEDKIGMIKYFIDKARWFMLGGGVANTFLKVLGYPLKKSLYDEKKLDFASKVLTDYPEKILLPRDVKMKDQKILDIGPFTINYYSKFISQTKTIIWNGPLGKIEDKKFTEGTKSIAKAIAKSKAFSLIGGGETTDFISKLNLENRFSFISTGGGAMLEYLSGKKLPGIEALK